ncbi:hypothetical protein DCS_06728 [Drechmeria coniospora]|uniref:deuterolysin n=1 Tax=Drechmeria coniospora TaxID=98403 RepID=A0A151GCC8_DRECN|nr:hypothetical protein DCS_06728 [Drechmeria coniospora]KYK54768.1 hypothetical protein DCS_06728 [Drechmeria coniospora]ODA76006.1 hypothetical protein RJ55_08288 [Drechmeria coniospora]
MRTDHYSLLFVLAGSAVAVGALSAEESTVATNEKRAEIYPDCGENEHYVQEAMRQCAATAEMAQKATRDPDPMLMNFFFKDASESMRSTAAALFGKIAKECGTAGGQKTHITCRQKRDNECGDFYGLTEIGGQRLLLCPNFFEPLEPDGKGCDILEPGDILLHEMTHALGSTTDCDDTYGIPDTTALPASENKNHADSFAHFARAVAKSCTRTELEEAAGGVMTPTTSDAAEETAAEEAAAEEKGTQPDLATTQHGPKHSLRSLASPLAVSLAPELQSMSMMPMLESTAIPGVLSVLVTMPNFDSQY